jgi:hypothetical protein
MFIPARVAISVGHLEMEKGVVKMKGSSLIVVGERFPVLHSRANIKKSVKLLPPHTQHSQLV